MFSGTLLGDPNHQDYPGDRVIAIKQFRPYGTREDCVRVAVVSLQCSHRGLHTHRLSGKTLAREMRVWSTLDHPNLLKLVGFCVDDVDYTTLWVLTCWQSHGDIPTYIRNSGAGEAKRVELVSYPLTMIPLWYYADDSFSRPATSRKVWRFCTTERLPFTTRMSNL